MTFFFLLMGCCAMRNKVKFHQCDLSGPLTVRWRCTTAIKILEEVRLPGLRHPLDGRWPVAQETRKLL